jgi:hypothetical protein
MESLLMLASRRLQFRLQEGLNLKTQVEQFKRKLAAFTENL